MLQSNYVIPRKQPCMEPVNLSVILAWPIVKVILDKFFEGAGTKLGEEAVSKWPELLKTKVHQFAQLVWRKHLVATADTSGAEQLLHKAADGCDVAQVEVAKNVNKILDSDLILQAGIEKIKYEISQQIQISLSVGEVNTLNNHNSNTENNQSAVIVRDNSGPVHVSTGNGAHPHDTKSTSLVLLLCIIAVISITALTLAAIVGLNKNNGQSPIPTSMQSTPESPLNGAESFEDKLKVARKNLFESADLKSAEKILSELHEHSKNSQQKDKDLYSMYMLLAIVDFKQNKIQDTENDIVQSYGYYKELQKAIDKANIYKDEQHKESNNNNIWCVMFLVKEKGFSFTHPDIKNIKASDMSKKCEVSSTPGFFNELEKLVR
jgi:hypothetical protein